MFLPLAHVFARYISVLSVASGCTMAYTADMKNLLPDLEAFRPTFLLAVPRVFEKVYNGAEAKAIAGGKGRIFGAAAKTAIDYSTALQDGKVPLGLKLKHALFEKLLYGKLVEGVIRSTFVVDVDAKGTGTIAVAQYNVRAAGHVAKLRKDLGLDA